MKTLVLTLFLYFSLFAAYSAYAGDNTLIANYPATSGSYNKIMLQNLQGSSATVAAICSNTNNAGLLFYDTGSNTLKICSSLNGSAVTVPYPETCFNRFSNTESNFTSGSNPCPTGYTQALPNSGSPDQFTTSTAGGYKVYSTVCCNTASIVHP